MTKRKFIDLQKQTLIRPFKNLYLEATNKAGQ